MVNATHYYESRGMYGQSAVRLVKLSTGVATRETKMDDAYFGEGLCQYTVPGTGTGGTAAAAQQRLIQITWKEKEAFIYNSKTLQELGRIPYQTSNGEGYVRKNM
jgi:glutaminyl-peptide cyclotransferase